MKNLTALIITIILMISGTKIFSESFYFYGTSSFGMHQYWELQLEKDPTGKQTGEKRRFFSNFLSGSFGLGLEMVIWDMGVKRGSRIYFKSGINMIFMAPNYLGYLPALDPANPSSTSTMNGVNLNGGAFYTGFNLDFIFGGSFPKTDLIWGLGVVLNFTFPSYSGISLRPNYIHEEFAFFAEPFISIGYDFNIPDTKMKITPQLRTGFTCVPLIPDFLLSDMNKNGSVNYYSTEYSANEFGQYSGLFVEVSVAITFMSIEWRK